MARIGGRKLSHQRRVSASVLDESRRRLLDNSDKLAGMSSFEDLFDGVEAIIRPIRGIGELTVYDTTLRIGAFLGLEPERVYVHAGTRIGAMRLGLDGRAQALDMRALPDELQALLAHQVEDVLCIYKDVLTGALRAGKVRSRCPQPALAVAGACGC